MNKIFSLISLFAFLAIAPGCAQKNYSEQELINRSIYDRTVEQVADQKDLPTGELALAVAKTFLGTQYVGGTLEIEPEALQVFLDKTDCILFVEMCTAFALTIKGREIVQAGDGVHFTIRETPSVRKAKPSYELLCRNIQNLRYRLGVIDGYASRLHYTSEWIFQAETNGLLEEFTWQLGEEHPQKFYFMTQHPDSYVQIQHDPSQGEKIEQIEINLEAQAPYFYISQERLRNPEIISEIHDGDIITFIDTHPGLDLAHVALACSDENGEMHFIHATTRGMEVLFEPKTLADYATNGLRVCRLK